MITEEFMLQVRWLDRTQHVANSAGGVNIFTNRVLQQQWKMTKYDNGIPVGIHLEWRDVPMVSE